MKIEIVCTYFERLPLLIKTVESLKRYTRKNFELVVVDDGSVHDISIPGERTFPICVIKMTQKTWTNSAIPFNRGFRFALSRDPDIIIIQNAECYHAGDILGYAEKHLTDKNYISFPCYSLSKNDPLPPTRINNRGAAVDGDSAWYNHPDYRPVGYHFCAAITAANLRKINGFDERFIDGKDYEDNYLLHQIKTLGLHIHIPEAPFVYHQWHYSQPRPGGSNKDLYERLIKTEGFRAEHIITPDL